jgi:hypothetical protein
MQKIVIISIIAIIVITTVVYFYYNNKTKKEDKSLLNRYLETNFQSNFIRNRITSKFYVDPIESPVIKLSQKNIDILKEVEKSICGSININWNIDDLATIINIPIKIPYLDENNEPQEFDYILHLPYFIYKLIGLFQLAIKKYITDKPDITFDELFNRLSNDERDNLAIISLVGFQVGRNVSDEEYKNYISFSKDFNKFYLKNSVILQQFKDLRNENGNSNILVEIKDVPELSRDDFIKYNIVGIISTTKILNAWNIFTKENVCSA